MASIRRHRCNDADVAQLSRRCHHNGGMARSVTVGPSSGCITRSAGRFPMLKTFACCAAIVAALLPVSELRAADDEIVAPTRIETIRVRDGVNIAVAVYLPKDAGRHPTLFAASPY